MDTKKFVWIGMIAGSALGNYIPLLWGGSSLSFTSIILGMVGGILGIWGGLNWGKWCSGSIISGL